MRSCRHRQAIDIIGDPKSGRVIIETATHWLFNVDVAAWCQDCGALAVWGQDENRREWVKPKKIAAAIQTKETA